MDSKNSQLRYTEWNSPEEMHKSCIQWISELDFIKDEHKFFEDLLKEYTLPVLEANLLDNARELVKKLSASEKREKELSTDLKAHRNNLKIMVDKEDQLEEEKKYLEKHKELKAEMLLYKEQFSFLKKEMFSTVTSALKKQKKMLN